MRTYLVANIQFTLPPLGTFGREASVCLWLLWLDIAPVESQCRPADRRMAKAAKLEHLQFVGLRCNSLTQAALVEGPARSTGLDLGVIAMGSTGGFGIRSSFALTRLNTMAFKVSKLCLCPPSQFACRQIIIARASGDSRI